MLGSERTQHELFLAIVQLCTALETALGSTEHWPPRMVCRSAYEVSLYAGPDVFAATSCFTLSGRAYILARLFESCNKVGALSLWPCKTLQSATLQHDSIADMRLI